MYGKFEPQTVFESMIGRNVITYTAIIDAMAKNGYGKEALHKRRYSTKSNTFVSVLNS